MDRHIYYNLSSDILGRKRKGTIGPTGIRGATGVRGVTGVEGATGIQGSTGVKGPTGPGGPIGFAGTGVKGAKGLQGSSGVQGDTGISGSKGDPGPAGAQGNSGMTTFSSKNYISSISTSQLLINTANINFRNSNLIAIKNLGNGILNSFNISTTTTNTSNIVVINNFWVAVGVGNSDSKGILYSTDGSNWNGANTGGFQANYYTGNGIAYGNNLWVAVGKGGSPSDTILYSTDGSNWNYANTGGFSFSKGRRVAYGNNLWVAVGDDDFGQYGILYSYSGSNWINTNAGFFNRIGNDVVYGAYGGINKWIAVGDDDGLFSSYSKGIRQSYDGVSWSYVTTNFEGSIGYGVAYGNNMWVAVGVATTSSNNTILTSTNGDDWNPTNDGGFDGYYGSPGTGHGVAYGNNLWVAVGNGNSPTNSILYSLDGTNWCNANNGFEGTNYGYSVTYGNGLWIACGKGTTSLNTMLYSTNGSDWYSTGTPKFSGNYAYGVAYTSKTITTTTITKQVININSNLSLNLVNNNFSITSFNSTLTFTPKLMSTLQGMS